LASTGDKHVPAYRLFKLRHWPPGLDQPQLQGASDFDCGSSALVFPADIYDVSDNNLCGTGFTNRRAPELAEYEPWTRSRFKGLQSDLIGSSVEVEGDKQGNGASDANQDLSPGKDANHHGPIGHGLLRLKIVLGALFFLGGIALAALAILRGAEGIRPVRWGLVCLTAGLGGSIGLAWGLGLL